MNLSVHGKQRPQFLTRVGAMNLVELAASAPLRSVTA
jgi:hypothetical protein